MNTVVFRMQLFKPSETFIVEQSAAVSTSNVLLMGRALFGPADARLRYFCPKLSRAETLRMVVAGDVSSFLPSVRQFGGELLHAHFSIDGLYAQAIAKRLDLPCVTTLHGFDVTTQRIELMKSGRPSLIRYALFQQRLKNECKTFICVSDFIKNRAVRAGFPEARLQKHFIGLDVDTFKPVLHESESLTLVHVARLVEKKGTSYLIRAFAEVAKRIPELRLNIIGDGPLLPELRVLARELGVESSVSFLGALPHAEVRRQLGQSTVLVLPSVTAANGDAEGLGMVLLEAAAMGVPTVATRHGGIPEAVRDGETGILVAERNVEELADAIYLLLRDEGLRGRMGAQARQMVERDFDIAKQSRALEGIYQAALQ